MHKVKGVLFCAVLVVALMVVIKDGRVMRTYDLPCELSSRALVQMANILWGAPPKPWDF